MSVWRKWGVGVGNGAVPGDWRNVQFEGGPISIGMQDQFSAPRLRDAIGPDYLSLGNRK